MLLIRLTDDDAWLAHLCRRVAFYDPSQKRAPKGSDIGGQWVDELGIGITSYRPEKPRTDAEMSADAELLRAELARVGVAVDEIVPSRGGWLEEGAVMSEPSMWIRAHGTDAQLMPALANRANEWNQLGVLVTRGVAREHPDAQLHYTWDLGHALSAADVSTLEGHARDAGFTGWTIEPRSGRMHVQTVPTYQASAETAAAAARFTIKTGAPVRSVPVLQRMYEQGDGYGGWLAKYKAQGPTGLRAQAHVVFGQPHAGGAPGAGGNGNHGGHWNGNGYVHSAEAILECYDPNQPRVPKGSGDPSGEWTKGGLTVEVDPTSQLGVGLERGVFGVRVLKQEPNYYWKMEKPDYTVAVDPLTPPDWVDAPPRQFSDPNDVRRFDPRLAAPDAEGVVRLLPSAGLREDLGGVTPRVGVLWRGMSAEEYAHTQKTGQVRSIGDYNLSTQKGLTYYTTDLTQAESYAHGFAPWAYAATPRRHAYVVGVRDPGNAVPVKGVGPEERGIPTPISTAHIVTVYEAVPYASESGRVSLNPSRDPKITRYEIGSSRAPRTRVAWREVSTAKFYDPNQPRVPKGDPEGGQWAEEGAPRPPDGDEPPEGYIRIYRGVNPERNRIDGEDPSHGEWYTSSYSEAVGYANWDYEGTGELGPGRAIIAVDVTIENAIEFAKAGSRHSPAAGTIWEDELYRDSGVEMRVDRRTRKVARIIEGDLEEGRRGLAERFYDPNQPRVPKGDPEGGQWTGGGVDGWALAGEEVDGLTVTDDVPNMSSISASLYEYEILDGIRSVPMSAFEDDGTPSFYSRTEKERVEKLALAIRKNKTIDPLIVVVETRNLAKGPYVLEGGHRFDALKLLGKRSFPALVVVDTEAGTQNNVERFYDPNQPRVPKGSGDPSGEWTSIGAKGDQPIADEEVRQAVETAAEDAAARMVAAGYVHPSRNLDPLLIEERERAAMMAAGLSLRQLDAFNLAFKDWANATATDRAQQLRAVASWVYGGVVMQGAGTRLPAGDLTMLRGRFLQAMGAMGDSQAGYEAFGRMVGVQRQMLWAAWGNEGAYKPDHVVPAFRGMSMFNEHLPDVPLGEAIGIRAGSASSWTADREIARSFAVAGGEERTATVVEAMVPYRNILGSHIGGWGTRNELELILNDADLKGRLLSRKPYRGKYEEAPNAGFKKGSWYGQGN